MNYFDVLLAKQLGGGGLKNIVSGNEKNLSNWTITGEVTNSFADGINTVEFVNGGAVTVADGIKAEFKRHFNVTITDDVAEAIATEWAGLSSDYKYYGFKHSNGYIYIYLSNGFTSTMETNFLNGSVYISLSGNKYVDVGYYGPSDGKLGDFRLNQYMGTLSGYTGQFILPVFATYQASLNFNGNISKSFTVEDGKYYLVKFNACSPSGFTKNFSDEIVFTSGSNSVKVNIATTASETMAEYATLIKADGTTLNAEFDLGQFINPEGVELNISDILISMV